MRRARHKERDPEPIEWLLAKFRKHLHLPDPGPLYALMGSVAANLMEGDPVWLMFVGAPSCGKTVLLESVTGMRQVFDAVSIKNEAAFLSGTAKKDQAKDATGGLLRQVGKHGAVVINDFTSILSLHKTNLDAILSVFRECYRGRWARHIGSEGGREMVWLGKVTFLGGVTGAIDQHQEVSASLGERWVYYRMDDAEGSSYERTRRALMNASEEGWKQDLKDSVNSFFVAHMEMQYGHREERRDLTDREMYKIIRMAKVGAKCRSAVIRDWRTKEVIGARETEVETRIATVLGQLLIGMERIGVPEYERWRVLGKITLDSMTRLRLVTVRTVARNTWEGLPTTPEELVALLGCSRSTVERTIHDLAIHGVLIKVKEENRVRVELTGWMKKEISAGWDKEDTDG